MQQPTHRADIRRERATGQNLGGSLGIRLRPVTRLFSLCFQKAIVRRGLIIVMVVGPILTLINQYDAIVSHAFGWRFFLKLGLTFLVPYCVSTYSSVMATRPRQATVKDEEAHHGRENT
jgi:hypothetical protein